MVHSFDPHVAGFGCCAVCRCNGHSPDAAATVSLALSGTRRRCRSLSWLDRECRRGIAARSRMDEADPNTLMRPVRPRLDSGIGALNQGYAVVDGQAAHGRQADPNTLMRTSEVMDLVQDSRFRVRLSTPRRNLPGIRPRKRAARGLLHFLGWETNLRLPVAIGRPTVEATIRVL